MSKKRILEINSVYEVGSTGRIVHQLCNKIRQDGNDYYVLYGRGPVSQDPNSYKIGNNATIIKNVLMTRILDVHGFSSKYMTNLALKKIDEFKPDLIHLHNLHGYYIDVEVLFNYIKKIGIPVVWTLHDAWPMTGHCAYFMDCQKWKYGCNNCQFKKKYPTSIILDNSQKNWVYKKNIFNDVSNLTIVTPSNWLANIVKESYLKNYKVHIINNGIDDSIFFKKSNGLKNELKLNNKFIILAVSNVWNQLKGYDDILKLAKIISDEFIIVMIGLNSKQLPKLPNNILGIERTNSSCELAEYYNMADVFINLTYADNYPTVNLEARACGLPVITYDVGGSPESAGNGAIVVPVGNYKMVYEEIVKLYNKQINNDNVIHEKQENVSNKRMLDEYINLIYNILDDKEEN